MLNILILNSFKILSDFKNGGTCFDNGGTQEFSCNCVGDWVGNECQTNVIDLIPDIDDILL